MLGLLAFIALPFVIAVGLSFTRYKLDSPLPICFIGLEQFRRIWADEGFRHALANNTLFAMVVVPLQTCIALGLAVLLSRSIFCIIPITPCRLSWPYQSGRGSAFR